MFSHYFCPGTVAPVSIDENADFTALGGDSLSAIRLSIILRKAKVEITARNIYKGSSVSGKIGLKQIPRVHVTQCDRK